MIECSKYKLSECCSSISDGDHLPPPKVDAGIPFITISDIDSLNRLNLDVKQFVPEEYYNNLKDIRKAQRNDILYSVVGSFGIPVIIKGNDKFAFQRHIAILRPDPTKVIPDYLFYIMKTYGFYMQADSVAIGAAQRTISLTALRNMTVELPSMDVQKKIASTLSRYDSLIENHQKQIKLLEEAAQRLYKEWFIDLRFPGHENTKIVDGVPEGWEKKKAIDFFTMSIGKTPPRAEKQWFVDEKEGIPWVSISDMKGTTFICSTSEGLTKEACDKFKVKIVPAGTILLSFKLTVGRVSLANMCVCTNEAIAHFQKDGTNWREYTYLYLKNYHYDSLGNTSGISKAVNSTIIKNMPFLFPSEVVLNKFHRMAKSYIDRVKFLSLQIRHLTEARDRLLPKLMSGEIEV